MLDAKRFPLRAEAERLLEIADYLAYRLRGAGIETADFDLPEGRVTAQILRDSGKITLSFAGGT